MPDQYGTPIPAGATIGGAPSPAAPAGAAPAVTDAQYSVPIPKDATVHAPADPQVGHGFWDKVNEGEKQFANGLTESLGYKAPGGDARDLGWGDFGAQTWESLKGSIKQSWGESQNIGKHLNPAPGVGEATGVALMVPNMVARGIEGMAGNVEESGRRMLAAVKSKDPNQIIKAGGHALGTLGQIAASMESPEKPGAAAAVVPKVATTMARAGEEFSVPLSVAQATSGKIATAVDTAIKKVPLSSAPFAKLARTQMGAVTTAADSIADSILAEAKGTTPTIRGEGIQQGLSQARQAASDAYGQALTKIKDAGGGTVEIPGANLGKVAGDLLKDIKPVEGYSEGFEGGARAKAQAILQNFEKIGNKPLTFENAVKLRQQIFQETNGAEISPYAGALKKMNHALHDEMVPALSNAGFKDLADNFQNASDNYRTTLDALDESVVKRLLNKDPADVGTFLVNNASPTAVATIKQLAPAKLPAVGRAVWSEIWNKALTGEDGMVAGKKLVNAWQSITPETKASLYGPAQVAQMDRFVGLVDKLGLDPAHKMMQRVALGPVAQGVSGLMGAGGLHALGIGFGPLAAGGVATAGALATPWMLAKIMAKPGGLDALSNLISAANPRAASVAAARMAVLIHAAHQEQLTQPPGAGN